MKKKKIVIVSGDDWEGLYIDGKIVDQGHRLRLEEVLRLLGFDVDCKEADNEWLEQYGNLPDKLKDVKESDE